METITYKNIKVDGVPFTKITGLNIHHRVNEHATASILGEVDYNEGKDALSRMDETTTVMVSTTAEGQPSKLFCGIVANAKLEYEGEYTTLFLELVSSSAILDIQKNKKSFQNTGMTHAAVINGAINGSATLNFAVSDKAIGSLIMQYNETNWEFTKRMASVFNAPVVADIMRKKPYITVGLPAANRTVNIESTKKTVAVNGLSFSSMSQNGKISGGSQQDFASTDATSIAYAFIGDNITSNGTTSRISGVSSTLQDGILMTTFSGAQAKGMSQPVTVNKSASGKMFKGKVQAVEKDKVQVHLVDIDGSYDGGGTHWFPYSTAYSSQDGSGFYCMPEVGDMVRVFFPSDNEKDAFAASSVNVSPLDNVKHKKWRTPGGKEILMTEEGIYITCNEDKIFINLEDEHGITITSDSEIKVVAKKNLKLEAKDVKVLADNEIFMGTSSTYIDMRPTDITLGAENVIIN